MKKVRVIALLTLVALLVGMLTGCGDPMARAKKALNKGDLEAAYRLLGQAETKEAAALQKEIVFLPVGVAMAYPSGKVDSIVYTYDKAGRLEKRDLKAGRKGYANETDTYTYDENGYIKRIEYVTAKGEDKTNAYVAYTCDGAGRFLSVFEETADKKWNKTVNTYNKDGRKTKSVVEGSGLSRETTRYHYDDQDRLILEDIHFANGRHTRHEYQYNDEGLLESETFVEKSGDPVNVTYTYNKLGLLSIRYRSEGAGAWAKEKYNYTKEGVLRSTLETASEGYPKEGDYKYNGKGQRKQAIFKESSAETVVTYTYDRYGNVKTMKKEVNGELQYEKTITWQAVRYTAGLPMFVQDTIEAVTAI